ncbi:dethiobiotin synthase [Methylobacterium sp. SD274]|uniref:dethiobiotin synthase n=1 Tax=Methylobacterium sp. SD274 TaxID=2782009 RepID=UPI001A96DFE0|nr:dethiobiotin synthase [Methylobacterium sp. SD274]MBO1022083.1 dethiobiotin synthase [Methylobacterium sp. SD274]
MVRPATTSSRRLSSRSDVRAVFVAGAGTEIGKTYVTASLTRALRAQDCAVSTLKPLASGVPPFGDPAFRESDTAILLDAQGMPLTAETVEACSPWRFAAPLSPDLAAAREGRSLSLFELVSWCEARLQGGAPEAIIVIEGVGGLMSPVTSEATGLDWLKALALPTILVSGSYLGAISHALTAAETLRCHGQRLLAVVVCESLGAPTSPETVADAIARHVPVPVVCIARDGECPEALARLVQAGSLNLTA